MYVWLRPDRVPTFNICPAQSAISSWMPASSHCCTTPLSRCHISKERERNCSVFCANSATFAKLLHKHTCNMYLNALLHKKEGREGCRPTSSSAYWASRLALAKGTSQFVYVVMCMKLPGRARPLKIWGNSQLTILNPLNKSKAWAS